MSHGEARHFLRMLVKARRARPTDEITVDPDTGFLILAWLVSLSTTPEFKKLEFSFILADRDVPRLRQVIEGNRIFGMRLKVERIG